MQCCCDGVYSCFVCSEWQTKREGRRQRLLATVVCIASSEYALRNIESVVFKWFPNAGLPFFLKIKINLKLFNCIHLFHHLQRTAARRVQDAGQGGLHHHEACHLCHAEAVSAPHLHPQHAGGQQRPHPELRAPHRPF